jgi:hypothetical protein
MVLRVLFRGLLVAMLPHIEPWVGVNLNGGGVSAEVHHPTMPRSAPEQEA